MVAGTLETTPDQTQVAPKLAIERAHQLHPAQGTTQAPQWIAGVKNFKRVLQRIAAAPINGRIDLDISPGEHQQGGPESIDRGPKHPVNIQQGDGR